MNTIFSLLLILSAFFYLLYNLKALQMILRKKERKQAYLISCLGTAGSAWIFFIPYYLDSFSGSAPLHSVGVLLKSWLLAAHHAIRLFVVDADFGEIQRFAAGYGLWGNCYVVLGLLLLLTAPLLTFSALAGILRELSMYLYPISTLKREHYVFSELNLQSFYLAKDIAAKKSRAGIVFMKQGGEDREEERYLKSQLRTFRAVLLPNSILEMDRIMGRQAKSVRYFLIGDDRMENATAVVSMLRTPPQKCRREIYVRLKAQDRLLDDLPPCPNTSVFRVEHIYSTVMSNLDRIGTELFRRARLAEDGERILSVLVVGLGEYGREMVKNLAWYTQVEGYRTVIHAFDREAGAGERLAHLCPGFFGEDAADRHCDIVVHTDAAFGTASFDLALEALGDVDYAFVAFGDDNANINAAYELRAMLARLGRDPMIQTVVRHGEISRTLAESKKLRGESYHIDFIGSYEEIYSCASILDAKDKEDVFREQMKWTRNTEEVREVLSHEEQYRMARADVMHKRLLQRLEVPEELQERSRHRSWVNFMFSEGYRHGPVRDNIAKLRPNLVAFDDLSHEP